MSNSETAISVNTRYIQNEMQDRAWTLVDKIIEGIPPLKECADETLDYKILVSMMTNSSFSSKDIGAQFFICLADYLYNPLDIC